MDDGCECCCDQADRTFGLCSAHLDEWMRSPERRAVPDVTDYAAWTEGLERFIKRVRSRVTYVN